MIGKRSLTWVGLILLAGVFVAVFVSVLDMRISKGDAYPHYATYRTDPLGASGLYEAFGKMSSYDVETNMTSLMDIDGLDNETVLFLLGVPRKSFDKIRIPDHSPVLKAIKENGTRLVLTIDPVSVPTKHQNTLSEDEDAWLDRRKKRREELRKRVKEAGEKSKEDKELSKEDKEKTIKEEEEERRILSEAEAIKELGPKLIHRFGIEIPDPKKFERPEDGWSTESGKSILPGGITKQIPVWRSQYRLEVAEDNVGDWKIAATVGGEPVVAERKLGKGSIVLTTDSYFASNEALYDGADSEFLLWLTGGKKRLVFDETMHGTENKTGTVKLIRQFRLHGFMIGLFIFVMLWAWKSASSLAPGDEDTELGLIGGGGTVSGSDAKSGFIRLLQRSIPGRELIDNCLATWKSSQVTKLSEDQQQKIDEIVRVHRIDPTHQNAVTTYQKIAALLRKK